MTTSAVSAGELSAFFQSIDTSLTTTMDGLVNGLREAGEMGSQGKWQGQMGSQGKMVREKW